MENQTLTMLRKASEIAHQVNAVQNDINIINSKLANTKRMNTSSYGLTISAAVVGGLPGLILGYIMGSIICSIFSLEITYMIGLILVFSIITHIVLLVVSILLDTKISEKHKKEKENRIKVLKSELDTRNEWISQYLEKHCDDISCVPSNYFYPIAIDYFIEVLTNERAESFKEAMNLYEEQLHRWKIEDMTKTTMIAQQQTAANSAAIRTSSAINAAANVANLLRR